MLQVPFQEGTYNKKVWKLLTRTSKEGDILRWGCPQRYLFVCLVHSYKYGILQYNTVYSSVPTNRHESTNTNRNEPRGHGTGKWKRTAGTEPKFCGNRTENHSDSYSWIWNVKLCENNYLSIHFLIPSFPSFPGLRITGTAEQLWPRNLSILMERLSKYCNPQYPCSRLNSTIPQPP